MHYHWSGSERCSMMSSQITVWALWIVALRVAHAAASSGSTSGAFISLDSSSCPLLCRPPPLPSPPTHVFSTAGCCSQAASWRLDVWLPRWLRTLPQDPGVNQEVVTSLRGELLSFLRFMSADGNSVKPYGCVVRAVMRCPVNKCSVMLKLHQRQSSLHFLWI